MNKVHTLGLCFLFLLVFGLLLYAQEVENYKIQSGDVLKISVLGEPDLDREARVSGRGEISYPLLGKISVKGNTSHQVEMGLTLKLNDFLVDPQVSVFVSEFGKIFVFGEVSKPGAFELNKGISLLEAITLAGGLSEHANPKKIKVIKKKQQGEEEIIQIDLTSITQRGSTESDIPLEPGDIVIVPESFL